MNAKPTLDALERAVRVEICATCPWRTAGSESPGPAVPRKCETHCELFQSLPRLRKWAVLIDPLLHPYEEVLQHQISEILTERGRKQRGDSPLNRYRDTLVGILRSHVEGRRRYTMRARDIMSTPVITVPESATLERVARLMLERKIGCVPVVGVDGTLRGILTESDFSAKARPVPFSLLRLPSVLGHWLGPAVERAYQEARAVAARQVMTADVVTVNETDTLEEAIRRMYEHNVHRLPVLRGGKPVGMLTRQNLLRLLLPVVGKPGGAVEPASSVPASLGA